MANGLPYYKAYPRDFLDGTAGMRFELKAAYRLLLDLIYLQGGRLPDDSKYIAGHLGMSVRKWNSLRRELVKAGKVTCENEIISNFRADYELSILRKLQDKQAENACNPRKTKDLKQPRHSHTDTDTDTERKKEPPKPPKGGHPRFEEFWEAFGDKRARPAAEKAFAKAAKDTEPEVIIAGAKRYAASRGSERKFWKMAQGWLNDRRWEDAPAQESKVENWMDGMGIKRDADPSGPRGGAWHPDAARGQQSAAMSGLQPDAAEEARPVPERDGGCGRAGGPLLALRTFEGCEI